MADMILRCEYLTLLDGKTIPLTMNFKKLLWLRANGYEKEVNNGLSVLKEKDVDMLKLPPLMWVAYLCAVDSPEYTEDEFLGLLPWELDTMFELYAKLNVKKKVQNSEKHSKHHDRKAK